MKRFIKIATLLMAVVSWFSIYSMDERKEAKETTSTISANALSAQEQEIQQKTNEIWNTLCAESKGDDDTLWRSFWKRDVVFDKDTDTDAKIHDYLMLLFRFCKSTEPNKYTYSFCKERCGELKVFYRTRQGQSVPSLLISSSEASSLTARGTWLNPHNGGGLVISSLPLIYDAHFLKHYKKS